MRAALAFLTVIGRAGAPTPGTLLWFPIVGALLGLAVGGVWVGAGHAWPVAAAAAVTLAADAMLTGGLHWDGLADTGDGLIPAMPPERRLTAMADPRIGAFGAVTVGIVLLVRYAALASGPATVAVVAGLWCGSRSAAAVVALLGRYARGEGMASAFLTSAESRRWRAGLVAAIGVAISVPLVMLDRPGHGAAAFGAELAAVAALAWFAARRVGGYTGDVLGAQIVLGETAGLLVWAARW